MKSELFRRLVVALLFMGALSSEAVSASEPSLKLHYRFGPLVDGKVKDVSGNGYDAMLCNSACVRQIDTCGILDLDTSDGYLDMGSTTGNLIATLGDFTISTYTYIDPSSNISGDGNFLWAFASQDFCTQTSGKYIAYRVNAQRYAQSTGGWNNEKVVVSSGLAATKGVWAHVCYTQSDTKGTLYLNGSVLKTSTASYKPSDIGVATTCNWIGRPPFSGDSYLKGLMVSDFRIYNRALNAAEVGKLTAAMVEVNSAFSRIEMHAVADTFRLYGTSAVQNDMRLPQAMNSVVQIRWVSSDPSILSTKGFVHRPLFGSAAKTVQLTAIFKCGQDSVSKTFSVTVVPYPSDADCVRSDLKALQFSGNLNMLRSNLNLPSKGADGSTFSWTSSHLEYLSSKGEIGKLPAKGQGAKALQLTVTAKKGTSSQKKVFEISLPEDEGYTSYLFAYFTGNSGLQESIRFALSADGINYRALNNNNPILGSDSISSSKAIRDPHIYRGPDNNFYMVVTDMKCANGWSSNHGIVLLKSPDLVNWKHSIIDIAAVYPQFCNIKSAWAPQTIWDPAVGKLMIYWSMRTEGMPDVFHYAYTNTDFTALETAPKVLFDYPTSTIDADIIYANGIYNLFFKTEGTGNGIKKAISKELTGPYHVVDDHYLQQTRSSVEGSCVFRLINSDTYILMYDVYTSGRYEFTSSTDLNRFKIVNNVSMNFSPRHGTVIPITTEEARRLTSKWGLAVDMTVLSSGSPSAKKNNVVVDETDHNVFIPVRPGTNLKAFDPKLTVLPGMIITPEGAQDFSKGALDYTLRLNDTLQHYTVSVAVNRNPILEGYYADPEILFSAKTGKFYLYPTSDGFAGWSGTSFRCFSSENLETWKDEGKIIDLEAGDVVWAATNAWAPCIVEKKINGVYQYFYYFCANKKIGVAVSCSPTGPFIDSGKALITSKPPGITSGQEIDPDVFTDPVSGKSYLYWGNGYMAGVELNEDMVSIKKETMKVMTPNSTFREAVYVIFRQGVYYFMWSEDDTGSPNYKVRYATSNSPLGKLTIPSDNIVIARDNGLAIYGTGHNSVLQLPGKDEWYIVYHRLTRPKGITLSSPGFYREVCMDKLEFNSDGSIKRTKPTLEGISPVTLRANLKQTGLQR
jgi:hypothetical protein